MVSEERMLSESAALLQKRWVVTRERMPGSFHARKYCPWHPWECIAMLKSCSVLWPEKQADALLSQLLAVLALLALLALLTTEEVEDRCTASALGAVSTI